MDGPNFVPAHDNFGVVEGLFVNERGWAMRPGGAPFRPLPPAMGGYARVHGGGGRDVFLHELVAYTFLPPPAPWQNRIVHINGDLNDNSVNNLEWSGDNANIYYSYPAQADTIRAPRPGRFRGRRSV